jgi:hypothetical protein
MFIRNFVDEVCEYQIKGLSNSFVKLMKENPRGFCISNMQIIDLCESKKDRFNAAIHYWAFKLFANDKELQYNGKFKLIIYASFFPGWILNIYYRIYRLHD